MVAKSLIGAEMFAKYLAQGLSGTFRLKDRLSREAFWPYMATISGLFFVLGLVLNFAGVVGTVALVSVFTILFTSAVWRRRNDIGYPGWTAVFWVLISGLYSYGQIIGPPIPKPVPEIPAGLGDAGIFLFLTPEFGSAASASVGNSLNELWYQLCFILLPASLALVLGLVEIFFGRKRSKTY